MPTSKLATNIKYFREKQDMTQLQLANKMNVSRPVITKWENEVAEPDLNALLKMSEIFSVSLDQLTGNHMNDEWVLKEFERIYSLEYDENNESLTQIIDFFIKNKSFMKEFLKLLNMPLRKQRALIHIFEKTIKEFNKL